MYTVATRVPTLKLEQLLLSPPSLPARKGLEPEGSQEDVSTEEKQLSSEDRGRGRDNGTEEEKAEEGEKLLRPRASLSEEGVGVREGQAMAEGGAERETVEEPGEPENEFILDGFDFSTGVRSVIT